MVVHLPLYVHAYINTHWSRVYCTAAKTRVIQRFLGVPYAQPPTGERRFAVSHHLVEQFSRLRTVCHPHAHAYVLYVY